MFHSLVLARSGTSVLSYGVTRFIHTVLTTYDGSFQLDGSLFRCDSRKILGSHVWNGSHNSDGSLHDPGSFSNAGSLCLHDSHNISDSISVYGSLHTGGSL